MRREAYNSNKSNKIPYTPIYNISNLLKDVSLFSGIPDWTKNKLADPKSALQNEPFKIYDHFGGYKML